MHTMQDFIRALIGLIAAILVAGTPVLVAWMRNIKKQMTHVNNAVNNSGTPMTERVDNLQDDFDLFKIESRRRHRQNQRNIDKILAEISELRVDTRAIIKTDA